MPGRW